MSINAKKLKYELYFTPIVKMLPDKLFCQIHYWISCKKSLNLKDPQGFNEKLQWLKLYYRKDQFTQMVDKYEAKQLVEEKIGKEYVIPALGIWELFDDIDFETLPDKFVLKCTHDSGGIIICRDKSQFDIESARRKLTSSLCKNYYYLGREWPYKNVKPRILAEPFMQNTEKEHLDVYKIMTFNGIPRIIQVIQNDKTEMESIDYFDCDWNLLNLRQDFPNSKIPLNKPKSLDVMLELASVLSEGFPFLRVDFYEINGEVFFSEFTFYSDCGLAPFVPSEWDNILGNWIELPNKTK